MCMYAVGWRNVCVSVYACMRIVSLGGGAVCSGQLSLDTGTLV